MFTAIVIWIVIGVIAGWIAASVTGTSTNLTSAPSFVENAVLGIIGAIIGGFVLRAFGITLQNSGAGFWLGSIIAATIGAIIFILIARMIVGSSRKL